LFLSAGCEHVVGDGIAWGQEEVDVLSRSFSAEKVNLVGFQLRATADTRGRRHARRSDPWDAPHPLEQIDARLPADDTLALPSGPFHEISTEESSPGLVVHQMLKLLADSR